MGKAKPQLPGRPGVTALYVRVSTDFQFEEGYSLEAQQQKLEQWCALKDISNHRLYRDGGWSGSNLDRPAMQELIAHIRAGQVIRVVVYKLDRLSRSQKDTLYLLEELFIPNGVEFISINENFDTGSPYGKAMIGILSVFAQLERENIRERTRMGMYERVKSGLWRGGSGTPFGYDYDPARNTLVPNEHAEEVRQIYQLYLAGYSTTQLAQMFPVCNDRHVSAILGRETYLGKMRYNGELFDGQHEAIIDPDTWERVQRERRRRSAGASAGAAYLLTGLLVCGKCGAKMRYQKWGKTGLKIYCYSQQRSKQNLVKDPNCDNRRYDAAEVEALVVEDVLRLTDRLDAGQLPPGQKLQQDALAAARSRCESLTAKIKRLYNLYAETEDAVLLETIRENQAELQSAESLLENEQAARAAAAEAREKLGAVTNLRGRWDSLSMGEKRRILRLCIRRIVLTGEAVDIEYLLE